MEKKIECLITTFGFTDQHIARMLSSANIFCDAIVRNQTTTSSTYSLTFNGHMVKVFNVTDKGLSKNRNEIIKLSNADYILFCDDDIIFEKNAMDNILRALKVIKGDINAIVFNIDSQNKERKIRQYSGKIKKCNFKQVRGSGIWRLLIKKDIASCIRFDENIGSGTDYLCGEDTLYMHELFDEYGNNIYICKERLGDIQHNNSLWFSKRDSDNYLFVKGHVYKQIYPVMFRLAILRFLLKEKRFSLSNYKKCIIGAKKWNEILKKR